MLTPSQNGTPRFDLRTAAAEYMSHGMVPIPLSPRSKRPLAANWQKLRPSTADLDRLFPLETEYNIGLLLGEPSDGLVDVDLDAPQAITAARFLLPWTGWVSGRASKPESHHWFRVDRPPIKATDKFTDLGGEVLVELRSTGGQTVVPPSVHESGESVTWYQSDQLAMVDLTDLQTAVRTVAAVALLARHWPDKGLRQDAYMALAGGLLRAGWNQEKIQDVIQALACTTNDEELEKRIACVSGTAQKIHQGHQTTGWPRLQELMGTDGSTTLSRIRNWLRLPVVAAQARLQPRHRPAPAPFQPFPATALPRPVVEFVAQGAEAHWL